MAKKLPYIILAWFSLFWLPKQNVARALVCPGRAPGINYIHDLSARGKAWQIGWSDVSYEDNFRIEAGCNCNPCPNRWLVPANTQFYEEEKNDFSCNAVNFRVCAVKAGCQDLCSPWRLTSLTIAPCLRADLNFDGLVDSQDYNFFVDCLGCRPSSCSTFQTRGWRYECELADINGDGVVNSTDNIYPVCLGTSFCKCQSSPPVPTSTPTPMPTINPGPKAAVRLLGRVVDTRSQYAACPNGRYYFGADFLNCLAPSQCWGNPDYTITWSQLGNSNSIDSNQCYDENGANLPRYTFEHTNNPIGDGDGEEITATIQMKDNIFLTGWSFSVTNDAGQVLLYPDSRQSGSFSTSGPRQTIRLKVYKQGGYYWNHLWFLVHQEVSGVLPTPTPTSFLPPSRGDAWIQTEGGDVHAGGTIKVTIPIDDEPFSLESKVGNGFPGVVSYVSEDNLNPPNFSPGKTSVEEWLANSLAQRNNYDYFWQLLGSPESADDHFAGDWDDTITTGFYYSDNSLTIDSSYTLPSDQRIVILVNGELTIDKDIIVPIGSITEQNFLAFIVKGNIEISPDVENLQGVYIADGEFKTGASDNRFIGEGIFMANKFDLGPGRGRDLGVRNQALPAEKFVFRPDFLINAYPGLWTTSYLWQEVAPH